MYFRCRRPGHGIDSVLEGRYAGRFVQRQAQQRGGVQVKPSHCALVERLGEDL